MGSGCTLEGNLRCPEFLKIEGTVNGEVSASHLVVGQRGKIEGEVETDNLIVFGEISGKVSSGTVEIKTSGIIQGELLTRILITEPGGILRGDCEMKSPEDKSGVKNSGSDSADPFFSPAQK